ncbi:hypothetical protein CPB83DRAFT_870726 [Crepidotus variabilis]|uniref:Uncharacterized protein n=1 Tax=Crepidotus variabilis TaxID=179855 RepID=A0A9P6EAE5_9AGAR|nr:hypothetical protein CPB83DRAFT_870726 [Crepidotus variabilis]
MVSETSVDDYPSLLWVAIPSLALISGFFIRKWYLARRLRLYGIGKGAPGFQTGVKQVRVTPEIAARIRRGEEVSPNEIAAASKKADEEEARKATNGGGVTSLPPRRGVIEERDDRHLIGSESNGYGSASGKEEEKNEWLPDNLTKTTKRKKGRR